MHIRSLLICTLSAVVAHSAAAEADHLPFTEGIIYEYERLPPNLGMYVAYFSGTAEVGGANVHVQHFEGPPSPLLAFWSVTPDGDKLYHGFHDSSPVLWQPPILMLDEPLYVGKSWEVDSQSSEGIAVHIRFDVTAFGEVAVPAGTYQAFTIRETVEWPEGGGRGLVHSHLRGTSGLTDITQQVTHHSYADGIGLILSQFGSRIDRLFSRRTVAVQPTTWTGIRLLYR